MRGARESIPAGGWWAARRLVARARGRDDGPRGAHVLVLREARRTEEGGHGEETDEAHAHGEQLITSMPGAVHVVTIAGKLEALQLVTSMPPAPHV
jgi:hypothetical protein